MCGELLHLVHRVPSLGASLEEVPSFLGVSADVPPEQAPGLDAVGHKESRQSLPRGTLFSWEDQREAGKTDGKRGKDDRSGKGGAPGVLRRAIYLW